MRNAVFLFSSRLFNSVLTLAFSLIAGRILSVEEHGLFGQGLARIFLMQAVLEAGLQFSLVRFLVPALKRGDEKEFQSVLYASLQIKYYVFIIATGLLAAVWFVLRFLNGSVDLPEENHILLMLVLMGGMGMSLISYLDALFVSHGRYISLSLWIPLTGIIRLLLLAVFWYNPLHEFTGEHAVFAYALSPYPSVFLFFLFYPASVFFKKVPPLLWRPWAKKLLLFNVWIVAASFMSIVSDWMELLMISRSEDAGIFNAARMPMQGFLILLATMQSMLLPRFASVTTVAEYRNIFSGFYRNLIPSSILLLPGFWIIGWFITAWYGPEYSESVKVFYILYPNFILRLFFAPLGTALFALDQPRWIAAESGVRMIAGFAANFFLIGLWGVTGAAWASLIAQSAGWALLIWLYSHYFKYGTFPLDRTESI